MHAMQAGHTSLESGMVRIMRMVGEVPPTGEDWHADVAKRNDFNWEDARRPVEAAAEIASSIMQVLQGFRENLDPPAREDGSE